MSYRLLYMIGGLSFIGLGYQVLHSGGWWSFKINTFIDFGETSSPVGYTMICVGAGLFGYSIFGKWEKLETFICPECEEIVERSGEDEVFCPKCGTKMEPLKGFYERHPELKKKPEQIT